MLRYTVALLGLAACASFAQEQAIVVTASRSAQLLRESIPHTTVITADEIRETQAIDLPSVLRREAGFEFVQNGGVGRSSGTFLRGTATGQSLILVDGVRVGDLNNGIATLDQIMLDEIERIEIVRGAVSSLYGSGAIGGVIQVFTRRGRGAPAATAEAAVGGERERRLQVGYGGAAGDTRFNLTASAFQSEGFSALRPDISPSVDPDRDGYRNRSLAASTAHRFSAAHEAGFSYYVTHGRQEYDNAFAPAQDDKQTADVRLDAWSAFLNSQLSAAWLSKLSFSGASNSNHDFVNGTSNFQTRTRNRQLSWQNDLALTAAHRLIGGLERVEQEIEGSIAYSRTARDVNALFAGYLGRFGAHSLQLNARAERYSDFGRASTHFVGYAFDASERWRLFASQGTGFRAPSFNELFFPPIDLGGGVFLACNNPDLSPERARSADAGVQYAGASGQLRMAVFHTRVRDLIQPGCPPLNVDRATIEGIETSYSAEWRGTRIKAAITLQDPVQHTSTGDAQLIRRAKRFGSLSAARALGAWRLGGEWLASGPRQDTLATSFSGERTELPGYGVVNATLRYDLGARTSAGARLDNVFDKDYSLTHGFNTQGRKLTVSLSHRF